MPQPNKNIRHGSYPDYYGEKFRHQDSRPKHFQEILNQYKDEFLPEDEPNNGRKGFYFLDIGCNNGKLTKAIVDIVKNSSVGASGLSVRALGVDIDENLIEKASSIYGDSMIEFAPADISAIAQGKSIVNPIDDYLNKNSIQRFDFVSCFSTLMYIHLNHLDDGLQQVLHYMCSVTNVLVLELHANSRYRNQAKKMRKYGGGEYSDHKQLQWKAVNVKIEQKIEDYLVSKGFRVVCDHEKKNERNRNIVVFSKAS